MSYLGKISAIVSANTSDFSAKLAASGKEVQRWVRSLESDVNKASSRASSSLRSIYTEAQRTERALQAIQARKIDFKGFSGQDLGAAVGRMQSLISATKEINEPLGRAARTLESLPVEIQGGFLAAMIRAQTQAESMAASIDKIGTGLVSSGALEARFRAIADRVRLTTEAVARLKEVSDSVGNLATGNEVRFRNPEFAAEMARARALQEQAAATPGGNFAGSIQRQAAAANDLAVAFARMEEARLTLGGDVAGTTAEYQRQLAILQYINAELDRSVAATRERATASELAFQAAGEESDRLLAAARADAQRRAEVASAYLPPVLDRESDVLSRTGMSPDEQAAEAARRAAEERRAADISRITDTGLGMDDPRRGLESLRGAIISVKGQLDELPDSVRERFAPAIRYAEAELRRLAAAPNASAMSIEAARTAMQRLTREAERAARAANLPTLAQGLERGAERAATAQMQAMESIYERNSRTVRDPRQLDALAASHERYRQIVQRGIETETLGSRVVQVELQREAAEYARLSGAMGGVRQGAAMREIARAGDVARGGVDRWGLAIQQAGFAVDDFMSSTGGFDQRLRAVSNNISQLAFILGGTRGLFIGLGVTLAGQAGVAIYRWINGGRTAEDMAKALNDTIGKQIENLKKLSDEYDRLGDSILGDVFAEGTREAEKFRQELEKIRKEQEKVRNEQVLSGSPEFIGLMGQKNRLEREARDVTDPGQAGAINRELARVNAEIERMRREPGAPAQGTREEIGAALGMRNRGGLGYLAADVFGLLFSGGLGRLLAGDVPEIQRAEEERARLAAIRPDDRDALTAFVRERLAAIDSVIADTGPGLGTAVSGTTREVASLRAEAARLASILNALTDPENVARDAATNKSLESLQRASVNLSATFERAKESGIRFSDTLTAATNARRELDLLRAQRSLTDDPAQIARIDAQIRAIEEQTAAFRSANEAASAFADAVKRISVDLAETVASDARSAAEKARRDANAAAAVFGVGGEFGRNGDRRRPGDAQREAEFAAREREIAAQEARRAQDDAERVRVAARLAREREQFERDAVGNPQIQGMLERQRQLQGIIDDDTQPAARRAAAADEAANIRGRLDRMIEDSPAGRAAAAMADASDRRNAEAQEQARQRQEEFRAAERGRDIGLAPGVAEAREAENALRDIAAARQRGFINQAQANEQANRDAQERMRGVGPAIFEMADQVANAVLQGPSRQALEMTDVSTMEGQRELNRLIRGDDASKNANIVELEKQNQKLTELTTVMRQVADRMGIVLDL